MKKISINYGIYSSPFGGLHLGVYSHRLCFLSFKKPSEIFNWARQHHFIIRKKKLPLPLVEKLNQYFRGKLKSFKYPTIFLSGTPFEKKVWQILRKIPSGEVRSYRWVAEKIGQAQAARAVGQANGRNRIPIVIPCHRVISSNGGLGGYSAGVDLKRKLLKLEGIKL